MGSGVEKKEGGFGFEMLQKWGGGGDCERKIGRGVGKKVRVVGKKGRGGECIEDPNLGLSWEWGGWTGVGKRKREGRGGKTALRISHPCLGDMGIIRGCRTVVGKQTRREWIKRGGKTALRIAVGYGDILGGGWTVVRKKVGREWKEGGAHAPDKLGIAVGYGDNLGGGWTNVRKKTRREWKEGSSRPGLHTPNLGIPSLQGNQQRPLPPLIIWKKEIEKWWGGGISSPHVQH